MNGLLLIINGNECLITSVTPNSHGLDFMVTSINPCKPLLSITQMGKILRASASLHLIELNALKNLDEVAEKGVGAVRSDGPTVNLTRG